MVDYILTDALQVGLNALLEYLSFHVLSCLILAFFIADAISYLPYKETALKCLGADEPKWLCCIVAATSGTILAICGWAFMSMLAGIENEGGRIGTCLSALVLWPVHRSYVNNHHCQGPRLRDWNSQSLSFNHNGGII
jgi:uncharacterized membrane protein YraQ (UPF0718 family)